MKPSFWQFRNKRFLTFKPLCTDECEEIRLDLLDKSRNILINDISLQDLLIYHAGIDSQKMTEKEINSYLKENIRFSTLVNVFQGFLFHNTSSALKKDYAANTARLLYQKGLMFTARNAIGLPDAHAVVHLNTRENGKLTVLEKVEISDEDNQPAMQLQHQFSIEPLESEESEAFTWQQDEPRIQFNTTAMEALFDNKLREKIIASTEEILDSSKAAANLSFATRP